jgi:undecaprenyl-diphosphatase
MHHHLHAGISYWQAIVLGLIQGVSELFPISSLGHTVILPKLFGWNNVWRVESDPESYWLAFVVGLHVGTALALVGYYWRDWIRIVKAFFLSLAHRKIEGPDARLAWLIVVATVPAGIIGLLFEHQLRVLFTHPLSGAIFLMVNALILFAGEIYRRRDDQRKARAEEATRELDTLHYREAAVVGTAQVSALVAGISRSGITMVAGLVRGLNHEDSARFAFLLATPIILGAGLIKLPDLFGPLGAGIRGQTIVGAACAGVAALVSVRFLMKYFETRKLWPFAAYCLAFGAVCTGIFA